MRKIQTLFILCLISLSACLLTKKIDVVSDGGDTPGGGGGGGSSEATLANSDLSGNWQNLSGTGASTACINSSQAGGGGAQSYYDVITFFGTNNFNYGRVYYDIADCRYYLGNTVMDTAIGGTYQVGALQSGSTFAITFTVSHASIRAYTSTMANWLNNTGCAGRGIDFTTDTVVGGAYDSMPTMGVPCTFLDQPGNNAVIANVVSKVSATTLKFGIFSTLSAGPGMLSGEATPTVVLSSPVFTKQ